MTYHLGVDLGTTYTAAAIWRDSKAEIANLGNRSATIPSVILLREDHEVLTGESATRRATTEPGRVAREFKRRLGDPAPIIVGGTPYSAAALMGRLLRWVVDKVTEAEGGPPATIAVSHPANWGEYKMGLLDQAIQVADLDGVTTLTEPEAAAIHYATQARVDVGSVIAVYDLGGGTFDAAVLRKTDDGFEILGEPQGVERLGGIDFDEAVFQHVVRATDGAIADLDPDDATAVAAVARLRNDCVDAKETLSADSDVTIPVLLPSFQADVRLNRAEFEGLIKPALVDSITSLTRALRSAGVEAKDLSSVLLVGGSSRIPLVAQLVGSELGRPVALDTHPKHAVALGTAVVAARQGGAISTLDPGATVTTPIPLIDPTPPPTPVPAGPPIVAPLADPTPPPEPAPPVATPPVSAPTVATPTPSPQPAAAPPAAPPGPAEKPMPEPSPKPAAKPGRDAPPIPVLIGAAVAAVVVAVAGFVILSGGDDPETVAAGSDDTTSSSTTSTTAATTPSTETTAAPVVGPFVTLSSVTVENDRFRMNYEVENFVPLINGGPDDLHLHFFLDTTAPENAGTNGQPQGVWEITDDPESFVFANIGPGNAAGATQLCGVVATAGHAVFDRNGVDGVESNGERIQPAGTCIDLP